MSNKLTLNINLSGKEPSHEPDKCVVEKAIPISHKDLTFAIFYDILSNVFYKFPCKMR